jgi:cardiolipin synthase
MDRVRLLDGGAEAFPAMLRAIQEARRFVHLEWYIFERDSVGRRFIEELGAAARRGVRVEVVIDGFGSKDARSIADDLIRSGARVRVHDGLRSLLLGRFLRNHRKLLLVDGEVAFAGGINLTAASASWADLAVEVCGPVCAALECTLLRGRSSAGDGQVKFLLSRPRGGRRLRRRYLQAISRARRSVRLAQAYFLPDHRLLRALTSAARRGVDVRVLLAGPLDVPLIGASWSPLCRRLLRGGVRVFRWTGSVLHAKAGSVDDRLLLVGSFNLDPMSLVNEELLVQASNPAVAREFDAWFDRHALLELTLEDCRPRFWRDVLAWILSWAGFFIARHLRRRGPLRRRLAFLSSDAGEPLLQGGKS